MLWCVWVLVVVVELRGLGGTSGDPPMLVCVSGFSSSGVSLKIMRMFRCVEVEGTAWLAADMRLQCYTSEWIGYASEVQPSAMGAMIAIWHRFLYAVS